MSDDGEPIRINFTNVEGRKTFHLLPAGLKLIVEVDDYTEEEASDESKNPGAKMINWTFTVESTVDGEETINARVRDPETKKSSVEDINLVGRRLFDRMVMVEGSYWRIKEFLDACWFDTTGEIEIWPDEMIGTRLIVQVGMQPGKKDKVTGQRYNARNKINNFFPLDSEKPAAVAAEVPAAEVKPEKATKTKKPVEVPEEAPV